MRATSILLASLMTSLALAGCTSDDAPAAEADVAVGPAEFTGDTGGVEGAVLDDEGLPVDGAMVGLGTQVETSTASGGRFTFSQVEPGKYQLFVQKLGYEAAAKFVDVRPGEVTQVDVVLSEIQIAEPFPSTLTQDGLFGCGASWRPAVVYSGVAACGVVEGTQFDDFLLVFVFEGPLEHVKSAVFEAEWQSNQVLGRGLSINWEKNGCWNVADSRFARTNGPSPHNGPVNESHIQDVYGDDCGGSTCPGTDKCEIGSRVFSYPDTLGASSPADVGITVQQRYTNHITLFFHEPGPEGFTVVGDQ